MTIVDVDLDFPDEDGPPAAAALQYLHGEFYESMLQCTACAIRQEAKQVVPGFGPANTDIVLFGQNPGEEEDSDGRAFVGRSGKELNRWLELLGIDRDKIVVGNILKCHTANNREPKPSEVDFCRDLWLPRELAHLKQASIILTLGNPASRAVLGKQAQSTGPMLVYWATVRHALREYTVYPVAHPSFVIRSNGNREKMYKEFLPSLRARLERHHAEAYERSCIRA